MKLRESVANGRDGSVVLEWFGRVADESAILGWTKSGTWSVATVASWTRSSIALEAGLSALDTASTVTSRSDTAGATRGLAEASRSSFTYRWLTADPEPDVVVIDLRRSLVVGPLLRSVDAVHDTFLERSSGSKLVASWHRSVECAVGAPVRVLSILTLAAVLSGLVASAATGTVGASGGRIGLGLAVLAVIGLRSETTMDELRESRGGRLVVGLLEPPEPGVRDGHSTDDQDAGRPPNSGREGNRETAPVTEGRRGGG